MSRNRVIGFSVIYKLSMPTYDVSMKEPFRTYSRYLHEKYGTKVYRVSVDAGFSCPNRSADRNSGGCTYCDPSGSRSPYIRRPAELKRQIDAALEYLKQRYAPEFYILYFQAFSGTFDTVEELRKIYDFGLSQGPFKELIVSTRPDCLDKEKAELLASYKKQGYDVWVELGLQSSCDQSLERINRGHSYKDFLEAYTLLKEREIKVAVHFIFGLPGEDRETILDSIRDVSVLEPEGIKIHNLHIPEKSPLFQEYRMGELSFPCSARHVALLADAIEILPPNTIIMRISTDTPSDRSGRYPGNFYPKNKLYNELRKELIKRNSEQGLFYSSKKE